MSKSTKTNKSYIKKALRKRKENSIVVFIIIFTLAIILDIINIIKKIIKITLIFCIIACISISIFIIIRIKPIINEYNELANEIVTGSTLETFKMEETTYIYDNDNNIIAKLRGDKNSEYITFDNINTYVIDAFVAVEDRTFWSNIGIDLKGLARVGINYIISHGDEVHGASTITQQLARNVFLTHEVSIERKLKEIFISLKLTNTYSKREIMEFYVNDICYANAIYGIEAASQSYFGKPSSELTLSQAAYLCAIPNAPEYYNPYKNPDRAVSRRNKILGDMLELKYITEEEYTNALNEKITIKNQDIQFNNYQSTFAVDCATRYLMKQAGFNFQYSFENNDEYNQYKNLYQEEYAIAYNKLINGGYRVYTTLDSAIQNDMQCILDNELIFDNNINEESGIYELQGALTVVDNRTGKIIALVGGRSQDNIEIEMFSLNRAYQSYRQPGSCIKPLVVYTPALMYGYTPNTMVYNINISEAKQKGADAQSLTGPTMTMRSALEQSKNGVAWQLFDRMGGKYCMSFLSNMHFSNICSDDYYNSSSLGGLTYGVTTVEMAGAYSTLANHGYYREPTCIKSIIDKNGNEIYIDEKEVQIYTEKDSDTIVDMMTGVLRYGTASKLKWYNETDTVAACKTGTTNESKDGWLCGFTPNYTVTVWVGYDKPKTLSSLYGATYPGKIWKECMLSLIEDEHTITKFEKSPRYYELDYSHNKALPEYAYDKYMKGKSDDKVLGGTYTVFDYRLDMINGEKLLDIINKITSLDRSNPNFINNITTLRSQADQIIELISGSNQRAEFQSQLDTAYNNMMIVETYNDDE